jgi:hypothetical protein
MATKPPPELLEFLSGSDPTVRSLALRLRTIVLGEMAPCHEYIFWMRTKVVLLYGSSDRVIDDNICFISVFARHVDLVFKRGADLDDPDGILEGAGKGMRHIKVKASADVARPAIRSLLGQSRRQAGLKPAPRGARRLVKTRVKPRAQPERPALPRLF